MAWIRLAAIVAVCVVIAEARYIQNPRGRLPNERDVLLQDYLAKRNAKGDHEQKHGEKVVPAKVKTPAAVPAVAQQAKSPGFHPEADPIPSRNKQHAPLLRSTQVVKPHQAAQPIKKQQHPLLKKINNSKKQSSRKQLLTRQQEVCATPECQAAADAFLAAMDPTVNPCEDFFTFSCGQWIESHPIPPTSSSISVFNDLRNNLSNRLKEILEAQKSTKDSQSLTAAKSMYQSCMGIGTLDTIGVQPLVDVLTSDYGGWPLTLDSWDEAAFQPQALQAFANLFVKGGVQSIAQIYVYPDDMNTDQTVIYIDQASLGLPRDFFLVPDLAVILDAYKALMAGTAKVIRDAQGSSVTDAQIDAEVEELIAFETKIAEILTPDEDRQNYTALYHKMTISDLQALSGNSPDVDWTALLQLLLAPAGVEITSSEEVVVYAVEYVEKFFQELIGEGVGQPLRSFANYMNWRYVYAHAEYTSAEMRDLYFQFNQVVAGITEEPERWLSCANLVNSALGFAVSGEYVTQHFPPAAKDEMLELIVNLRAAFDDILDNLEWMDEDTKARAKTKLEAMREFVAYPDWILDDAEVDAFYAGVTADPATLFANIYSYEQWAWVDLVKALHQPTNRDLWITFPSIVNAFFYPSMNSITFPAGILQPPFFQSNRIQALNYGGIGMVIGHEMTHGFDNNGRQYDEAGNLVNWWTDVTGSAFVEKAQCFIDQYTGYAVPELNDIVPDAHLNGLQTLGENIADNGGMREAWNAYLRFKEVNGPEPLLPGLEQYTPEQLFFINFGNLWCGHYTQAGLLNIVLNDEHSPGKYRVWGTASNSPAFAEAFGCTADDPMANGPDACQIW